MWVAHSAQDCRHAFRGCYITAVHTHTHTHTQALIREDFYGHAALQDCTKQQWRNQENIRAMWISFTVHRVALEY